jgi:hypothetical protein
MVESLPESRKIESEDGGITFTYRAGEIDGKVQLIFDVNVTQLRYSFEQYAMLRLLFNEVASAAGEQVVFKKST